MTTSPPAGRNPVRQQLDELDALLQRMLALPVNQSDDVAAATEPNAHRPIDPPPRAPALLDGWKQPPMMLLTDSGPVAPPSTPEPPRWDPSWGINLNPQNGSSILGARSPAASYTTAAPEPTPQYARAEPAAPPISEPEPEPAPTTLPLIPEPAFRARPSQRPRPPSLLAWPFAALDQLFDTAVSLVPLGSLFTTRVGKDCVGVAGLVMLAAGVTWGVLDFLGWTH
jgi:hypothetical protein